MAMSSPLSDGRFHVENSVILTTKDEISCQQTFNYLSENLDRFNIGTEFVVVCGIHGSPGGQMLKGDEDFRYDYESMFRWFRTEKRYNQCAPKSGKPFQLVEERQYQMGTVVELSSVRDPDNGIGYKLDEKSKIALKTQFERLLATKRPVALFLASCWSHSSEISDILRSCGVYSTIRMLQDQGELTEGQFFKLDSNQIEILSTVASDHNQNDPNQLTSKNVFLYGSHGTGKTILLSEIFMMRLAYYKMHKIDLCKKIIVSFSAYSEGYQLLKDIKEKHIGIPPSYVQYSDLISLCHEFNVSMDIDHPLELINNLIQKISIETKDSRSIFFLDEVFGKNQLGESNVYCDWSNLRFPKNVDVLMAVNPQGISFKQRFEVFVPANENTLARRLVGKHRNCSSISSLLDHYKALFEHSSYLESSLDIELEMPSGTLPVWIQKEKTESHYSILKYIKDNFTSSYSVTLLYHDSSFRLSDFDHISQWCKDHKWRCIEAGKVVGSEDQIIVTYNFPPGPEHISRARNGLVMVTTKGQKYKTFDNLIKIAVGHGKNDYICDIIPSCSFAGIEFVSSLTKRQRNDTKRMISVKHPNYLNYGHSEGEDVSMLKKKRFLLLMSLAIMIILTGVALAVGFGLGVHNSSALVCQCNPFGSTNKSCDQIDGKCICKTGYEGMNCDKCASVLDIEEPNHESQCSVKGYLLIGGSENNTEFVKFITSNSTPFYGQLPETRIGSFGAMLGDAPIVCGGRTGPESTYYNSCLTFENSQWSPSHIMNEKRAFSAGVLLNSSTFWILGGFYFFGSGQGSGHYLNSTEFIHKGQTNGVSGPTLPYELSRMCAVKLTEEQIFLIGGRDGTFDNGGEWPNEERKEVWIFNPKDGFSVKQGISLNTKRSFHSCSTMRHDGKTVIVVAGGFNSDGTDDYHLDSVEIYDPDYNAWYPGPSLPYKLSHSSMAESPDGKGVLLFGGLNYDDETRGEKILELRSGASSWTILDVTLQKRRDGHILIPIT